ncbi:hypothetical protein KJ707_00405 [Patescibacteria group bacterium]|nr:hypothetical protein [Patescibacteria group bacterium]MBU1967191.1 hypothetical protein [Patescibacteria group bacterium]MBU2543017.1 hypothetical protein [Patescibacteria group bacterium]
MQSKSISQSGQVGLVVLLIMTGMLTIGMSLAARTTQEAFTSGKESESARVFNAAEQGVEQALSSDLDFEGESTSGTVDSVTGVDVAYTINKVANLETRLFEGVSVGVDVTGVSDGDVLQVDWSHESDCVTQDVASLMTSVYYDDVGTTRVRHYALGGCNRSDGFDLGTVIDENGYKRRYSLSLLTNDFLVRFKPVYNDTHVKIASSDFTMLTQYYSIRSKAAKENSNETRIVEVNRTSLSAPSIFDYALYSGGNL